MRKITLVLAVLLLAGCCGFLTMNNPKDVFQLVPKTADVVIIVHPSAILNDSDLSSYTSSAQSQINSVQQESGMDPSKITTLLLFTTSSSIASQAQNGGVIIRGILDRGAILSRIGSTNTITNSTYDNSVIYEASPTGIGNPSYFTFLDDSTLVIGASQSAVQDTIDVNSGKMDSIASNQNFSQMYASFDPNSLVVLMMANSPTMKNYISSMGGTRFDTSSLSSADYFGLSILKQMKNINIKLLVTADDTASANSISTLFNKVLSALKGITKSGSAAEALVDNVSVATNGNMVTMTLPTTSDQLKQVQEEMQSPMSTR